MPSKRTASCTSCAFKTLFRFSSIVGINCVTSKCVHTNVLNKLETSYAKIQMLTALTLAIFCGFGTSCSLYEIITTTKEKLSTIKFGILATNLLICLKTTLVILACLRTTKLRKTEHVGINEILFKFQYYNFEFLLKEKFLKTLRRQGFICVSFAVLSVVIYGMRVLINLQTVFCKAVIELSAVICLYLEFVILIELLLRSKLYMKLFKECHQHFKEQMSYKKRFKKNVIAEAHRLHSAIMCCMKYWSYSGSLATIIWLLTSTAIWIVNFYVMLKLATSGQFYLIGSIDVGVEIQMCFTTWIILKVLDDMENLQKVVSY